MDNKFSIAVDGPVGSGKSTISKLIAKKLKIVYVDTGAMYRAVALYFIKQGIDLKNKAYIISNLELIDISIQYQNNEQILFLNGVNVNSEIRSPEISMGSSLVSQIKEVRQKLVSLQKKLAKSQNIIMDGRDIGTNVLPDATLKIYLSADIDERAKRRYNEHLNDYNKVKLEEVKEAIIKRDYDDMTRKESPLKKASDAVEIDTTNLTIEQVADKIISLLANQNIIN